MNGGNEGFLRIKEAQTNDIRRILLCWLGTYLSFYFSFKPRILELDRCELLLPRSTKVRVALPVLFLPTSYIQLFLSVVPSSYWAWLSSCLCFSPKHADALRFPDHNKHFSVVPSLLLVADGFLAIPLGMVDKRSQRNNERLSNYIATGGIVTGLIIYLTLYILIKNRPENLDGLENDWLQCFVNINQTSFSLCHIVHYLYIKIFEPYKILYSTYMIYLIRFICFKQLIHLRSDSNVFDCRMHQWQK